LIPLFSCSDCTNFLLSPHLFDVIPNNAGKVGIGTENPTAKLDVVGSAKFSNGIVKFQNLVDTSLIGNEILIIDSLGNLKRGGDILKAMYAAIELPCKTDDPYNNPELAVWKNGPGKLYVQSNCYSNPKVGIGTANPDAKLTIKLSDLITKPIRVLAANSSQPDIMSVNAQGQLFATTFRMKQLSASEKPIIITNHLNTKILQLETDGLLRAREVKVDLEAWPDYVFTKNYRLLSLPEVEIFINQNGHLPNVPSAKTIETEGLSLGEANKILMEKVEEMTLYMIEIQKQMEAMKAELQLINQKN
jgi:hypothetical protein